MKRQIAKKQTPPNTNLRIFGSIAMITLFVFISILGYFVVQTKTVLVKSSTNMAMGESLEKEEKNTQFPVGVDPSRKMITENDAVDTYFEEHISSKSGFGGAHTSWLGKALAKLALAGWYQNLASPTSRMLVIQSGERKEQVAENFGKILGWDKPMRAEFMSMIASSSPEIPDGKFFPGTYVVARGATPSDVVPLVTSRFAEEILARYGNDVAEIVPLEDALTIASLLEREAYDFTDMRQIAGVIWNRLFTDMNLQLDATLQYAKGSKVSEPWWPRVRPADKYIESPFNTYENEGLPPSPIANPSLDAVLAALNPKKTECMYYFHDKNAGFHCTPTYEEHVRLLKEYYGRGK